MKTKLTLSIDPEVIEKAHQQAKQERVSVSQLFSDFIRHRQITENGLGIPTIDSMLGILKNYPIDDSKAGIRSSYVKKHFR